MSEKVVVEFTVQDGKREIFLESLQEAENRAIPHPDGSSTPLLQCLGYRADDYVGRREALVKFVDQMEIKLRRNEHKKNWREQPIEALFRLLMIEIEEFKVADEFLTVAEARTELVDIANFALILFDRLGQIDQERNRHEKSSAHTA